MKKLFRVIFVCLLCLTLAACGDQEPCAHDFKIVALTDASCEQTGSKTCQCSICGLSYTEEIPAVGHDYADATCVAAKKCQVCGTTEGTPLAHTWQKATCNIPQTCSFCGKTEGDPLAHTWQAATCNTPKTCTSCGITDGGILDHVWAEATCEDPKCCLRCDATEGQPLGHDWIEATCLMSQTCTRCAQTQGTTLQHSFAAATCTHPATCVLCGEETGEPNGHSWTDATCFTPRTCAHCGETDGEAINHNYVDASCTEPKTCTICADAVGEPLGHAYQAKRIDNGSCCRNGQMEYSCTLCAHSYVEEIPATTYTAAQIYERYKNSVGEIITYDEYGNEFAVGTCIVYDSNGRILTNYHVIAGAHSAKVTIGDQTYDVQYICAYEKFIDLAILEVNATGLKAAVLCEDIHVTGSAVYAIGSSYGLSFTLSEGIISYAERELNGVQYVQHNAPISEGNSGGPLINEYGEVIGINTMFLLDAQNLNFAIRITELSRISGTKMTMQEFYNHTKENDAFLKMKNYIVAKGKYDEINQCYQLPCTYSIGIVNPNLAYRTDHMVCYFDKEDIIALIAMIIDTNGQEYCMAIILDANVTGVYEWSFYNTFGHYMVGAVEAGGFVRGSVLEYALNNIEKENERNNTRKFVTKLTRELLSAFDSKFRAVGMTVKDIGFLKY